MDNRLANIPRNFRAFCLLAPNNNLLRMFSIYSPEDFRADLESCQHIRVEMAGHGPSIAIGDGV